MFITEQQLALYKYQVNGKYFGKSMAEIAKAELLAYMYSVKANHNPIELLNHFWNRRIDKNVWCFQFPDESRIAIMQEDNKEKQCTEYHFSLFTKFDAPFR